MVFNDVTNKSGLIQSCEFWCRFPDAGISGASTLLKQFTVRLNSAFERIMPLLLSYSDYIRWDDTNHPDRPIGTTNLVSGQNDYTISSDDNSLSILNLIAVEILTSSTATSYIPLEKMTADNPLVIDAMSPNTDDTGIPRYYVENGNNLFLYPKPNYSATNGIKIFFSREQDYFASDDTTQEPGIPKPFHELLALYASLDWTMVNRTNDGNLISMIQRKIQDTEKNLKTFMDMRYPTRLQMTMKKIDYI